MDDIVAFRKGLEYTWGWEESVATSLFSPLRSSRKSDTSQCHWLLLCLGYFHCKQVASYFCRPFHQSKTDIGGTPASSLVRAGGGSQMQPLLAKIAGGTPSRQKIIFGKNQRCRSVTSQSKLESRAVTHNSDSNDPLSKVQQTSGERHHEEIG